MSVSVKIEGERREQTYPFVGIREDGLVVLFKNPGQGCCLVADADDEYVAGEYVYEKAFEFRRLVGSITITSA